MVRLQLVVQAHTHAPSIGLCFELAEKSGDGLRRRANALSCETLRDLAEEWQAMHHGIICGLALPATVGPLDAEAGATIYRIVQVGSTNVARLPPDFRRGYGLLRMTERVRKLGGRIEIAKGWHAGPQIVSAAP